MVTWGFNHQRKKKIKYHYTQIFKYSRSTQDAILCLLTTVTNFIDIKSSHYARCLFLDFSSAFNTIRVEYLIPQLQHLDTKVTGWITSFLSQRKQQTLVKDKLSRPITTNTGTPQGSDFNHQCKNKLNYITPKFLNIQD